MIWIDQRNNMETVSDHYLHIVYPLEAEGAKTEATAWIARNAIQYRIINF